MQILQQQFEGKPLRITERDGQRWFVLADVCAVLEIKQPTRVAERLDEDEKGVSLIHTPGGQQEMTVVNESGLYAVILRSDKPQARPFRKWITNEVLPALRTKGSYTLGEKPNTLPPLISARLAAVALDCSSKSAANRLRHRGIQASHHYLEPLCGAPAFLYPLTEVQKVWPNIQFQPYTGLIHEGTGEVEHRVLLSKQGKAAQAQHLFFNAAEELGAQLARTMVEEFINTELPARLRAALTRGVSA
ncbi:Bro-N domain-containing protein [Deinococcus altitudinis]|uniref:BRO-N domain-containing protein n=1 Tax=Deinococcus altitudinis TaxID=468914 RepID=UPI003891A0D8